MNKHDNLLAGRLEAISEGLRSTVTLYFFAFYDESEEEDLMELSTEERKKRIKEYEELVQDLKKQLDDLIAEEEASGKKNATIGAIQRALMETEIELARLHAIQALLDRLAREMTPEQWRKKLSEAIREGQEAALLALVIEIFAPIVIAHGFIGFRALISFLQQYFRINPRPPYPLRWDAYMRRLARHIEKIKDGLRHRDLTGDGSKFWEAVRKWRQFMDDFHPVG